MDLKQFYLKMDFLIMKKLKDLQIKILQYVFILLMMRKEKIIYLIRILYVLLTIYLKNNYILFFVKNKR